MQTIDKSPIANESLHPFIKCKDYLVSQQEFNLQIDTKNQLLVTSPRPLTEDLGSYYESQEYISHQNEAKTFFEKAYVGIRNYMLIKKWRLISKYKKGQTALDIGCGTGDFITLGKELGWNVEGIEISNKAREIAITKTKTIIKKDIFDPYFDTKKYDVITLWHVLEHLENPLLILERLKQMLSPKGIIVIAVPNFKSYDAQYYGQYWAAYDVPRHLFHFSQTSIQNLANLQDMQLEAVSPLIFDSYYVSLLSEQNKYGQKKWINAFLIGFWSNFKAWSKGTKEYSSLIYILKNA